MNFIYIKLYLLLCIGSGYSFFHGKADLIIKLNSAITSNPVELSNFYSKYDFIPKYESAIKGVIAVRARDSTRIRDIEFMLRYDNLVEYFEPDNTYYATGIPNDPGFGTQWGLYNKMNQNVDVSAVNAWSVFRGTRRIIVGIIDTGIDYKHPDLCENIWTNPGEIPANGIDDDLNGYIDDIHGWNFVSSTILSAESQMLGDPMDFNSHGTHISGIIGAVTNNRIGIAGLCPNVQLMACKGLSDDGSGFSSDLIRCIYYAVDNGAAVINASWGGGGYSKAMQEAISYAEEHNVIFVAAAGNDGSDNDIKPFYPASYPNLNIVSVAASDSADNIAWFSNFGNVSVDIAAPGQSILSTVPSAGYAVYIGTSTAAPFVSATLALMIGCAPNYSASYYIETLLSASDRIRSGIGRVACTGRVNTYRSLVSIMRNRRAVAWKQATTPPESVLRYLSVISTVTKSKGKIIVKDGR